MFLERSVPKFAPEAKPFKMDIADQHRQLIDLVAHLSQPELQRAIADNRVTFGLIRPQLNDPTGQGRSQPELHREIINWIPGRSKLRVAAHASLLLDLQAIQELWEGYSRQSMESKDPLFAKEGKRWHEFEKFMRSGPSEVLLLFSQEPGAVKAWREYIGNTWKVADLRKRVQDDLAAVPRYTHLRARYAPEDPQQAILNNGFHGSSKTEDVARELEVIRQCAQRQLTEQQAATS